MRLAAEGHRGSFDVVVAQEADPLSTGGSTSSASRPHSNNPRTRAVAERRAFLLTLGATSKHCLVEASDRCAQDRVSMLQRQMVEIAEQLVLCAVHAAVGGDRRGVGVGPARIVVFGADLGPFSSWHGPQAALTCPYRSDRVTR